MAVLDRTYCSSTMHRARARAREGGCGLGYQRGSVRHRPIRPEEIVPLEILGARLRLLRQEAGLSRDELAARADMTPRHLGALERGDRRTRRSTLSRLSEGMVGPFAAPPLVEELVALAGPVLAPESRYTEQAARTLACRGRRGEVERRRRLRARIVEAELGPTLRALPRDAAWRLAVELVAVSREAPSPRRAVRLLLRVLERDLGPPASQVLPGSARHFPSPSRGSV